MSDAPTPLEVYYASEYHRRNMQVARVCGAQASVDQALERALTVKSIPVWLIAYLESAANRLPGLQIDLAAWRDLAPDAPETVRAEAAEAKLRKAVGALGDISNGEPEWPDDPQKELDWCRNRATTALAGLNGGTHGTEQ